MIQINAGTRLAAAAVPDFHAMQKLVAPIKIEQNQNPKLGIWFVHG